MAKFDIIAATGCPTGIAHTFMAKEALEKAAAERGLTIKVETHGQVGVENELTKSEIAGAKAVVVAADKDVQAERFAGKPMVSVGVSKALSVEAAGKLIRQGHKRIVLVSGQLPNADVEYLAEAISIMYTVFDGHGEVRRVNVNVGPLSADQYSVLLDAEVGNVLIYQDTYHPDYYKAAHVAGPKSHYEKRLNAPEVALGAGVRDVGLGLLLGLAPWQFDVLATMLHVAHLNRLFGAGGHTISMFRLRPAPGSLFVPPHPLSDDEFLRCVAIMRLAVPHAGVVVTTREPSGLWRDACSSGVSQVFTGSVGSAYETWSEKPGPDGIPFPLGEDTHLDEVVRFLMEEAEHLPSFCTACPRLGRSGADFMSMVRECGMRSQCSPNSIASFEEFLINYATPFTREAGERLIARKLPQMSEVERGAAERLLQKVKSGRMDEFI